MITIHVSSLTPHGRWQGALLESSFLDVRQPGELVRLVSTRPGEAASRGTVGRVVGTRSWNPHPWTGDRFEGYQLPAAVLHWLAGERLEGRLADGSILLLGPLSLFRAAAEPPGFASVEPGRALATPWPRFPHGSGPFGLDDSYAPLARYCVDTKLELPRLTLPALIDVRDLFELAPRWLELTALVRLECPQPTGRPRQAERIAFLVAACEHSVTLEAGALAAHEDEDPADAPILCYERPVESPGGEIVFDPAVHRAGDPLFPERAKPGLGRELLQRIARLTSR